MGVHRTCNSLIHAIVHDPQPLWRRSLTSMLVRSGVQVVAECATAEEMSRAGCLGPQLVVADPGDAGGAFVERLRELRESAARVATIVVSSREDDRLRRDLEAAGAVDFIQKDCELDLVEERLNRAIEEAFEWSRLTPRELEILELVAPGRSNHEVAAALWLSDETVKFHLANVYRKLSVPGRREAVDLAWREGILSPDCFCARENGRSPAFAG